MVPKMGTRVYRRILFEDFVVEASALLTTDTIAGAFVEGDTEGALKAATLAPGITETPS